MIIFNQSDDGIKSTWNTKLVSDQTFLPHKQLQMCPNPLLHPSQLFLRPQTSSLGGVLGRNPHPTRRPHFPHPQLEVRNSWVDSFLALLRSSLAQALRTPRREERPRPARRNNRKISLGNKIIPISRNIHTYSIRGSWFHLFRLRF